MLYKYSRAQPCRRQCHALKTAALTAGVQHPLKLRPCTTYLNPPVIITIATLSSLQWFPHWLEDRHGYTNAAKNLNELNVNVSVKLIPPITTHTHKKFRARFADFCLLTLPKGTTLIMADSGFKIRLIYKWHLVEMSFLMNMQPHTQRCDCRLKLHTHSAGMCNLTQEKI